jgi:hypothetical protein
LPRPDHRRRVPFTAAVYAPLPGGLPDPAREYWHHRPGYYQQIDLARAYAYAERLPVGSVVVVDMEDRLGRARRAAFWVASADEEFGVRHLDPLTIEDCPDGMFPQVPHERPRRLRRSLSPPL